MKNEVYGGPIDGLHPDRHAVVLDAMLRWDQGRDTAADRVILWFDVALQRARAERYGSTYEK